MASIWQCASLCAFAAADDVWNRDAIARIESASASRSVSSDALFAKLSNLAVNPDGTVELESSHPSHSTPGPRKRRVTPPPSTVTREEKEIVCYEELEKRGGRPVCSIEAWQQMLTDPDAPHDVLLPWLLDPDEAKLRGEKRKAVVFSQQLDRWWDFLQWQWDNRDIAGSDDIIFSSYLETQKTYNERTGAHRTLANPSFNEITRRTWQAKIASRLPKCDDGGFSAYSSAVKRRLAPHNFRRALQLRKDPRLQTAWVTWLEYLDFEQLSRDRDALALEAEAPRYDRAWRRLVEAKWLYTNGKIDGRAAATEDLTTARAAINDFIQATAPYRHVEAVARCQQARVEWILSEARGMEVERPKTDAVRGSKRMRSDVEEVPEQGQEQAAKRRSVRTRRGDSRADVSSQPTVPGTRRSLRQASASASTKGRHL